jgi:hypothetical protein
VPKYNILPLTAHSVSLLLLYRNTSTAKINVLQVAIFFSLLSTVFAIPTPSLLPTALLIPRQTSAPQSTPTLDPAPLVSYFTTTKQITIPGVTNPHVTLPAKTIDITIPTCIKTITPDENGYVPPGTCGALYDYYPSFAAAVAAAVIFGILTDAACSAGSFVEEGRLLLGLFLINTSIDAR